MSKLMKWWSMLIHCLMEIKTMEMRKKMQNTWLKEEDIEWEDAESEVEYEWEWGRRCKPCGCQGGRRHQPAKARSRLNSPVNLEQSDMQNEIFRIKYDKKVWILSCQWWWHHLKYSPRHIVVSHAQVLSQPSELPIRLPDVRQGLAVQDKVKIPRHT